MRLKNVIHASTYIRGYPMLTLYIADAERDAGMKNLSRKEALEILNGMKVKIKIPKAAVMQNKRNAALDMAIEALKYSEIKLRTEILPAAQPEIIRCKDCKHRDEYGCCRYWKGQAMSEHPIPTDDYDFCSMAKRRGDG